MGKDDDSKGKRSILKQGEVVHVPGPFYMMNPRILQSYLDGAEDSAIGINYSVHSTAKPPRVHWTTAAESGILFGVATEITAAEAGFAFVAS